MSKPTEAQVRALEKAHKSQYLDLITANRLWIKLLSQVKGKPKESKEMQSLLAFGRTIANNAGKWYARQYKLEQLAKIPPVAKDIMKYFLVPKEEAKLIAVANTYLDKKESIKGLGFVPLLIWGAIVLIASLTAYQITDELNTTAEEKKDLLKQTQATLKDLNVTGTEAAAIISSTQQQASANETGGLFGGMMPKLALAALGIYLFMNRSNKKTAHG